MASNLSSSPLPEASPIPSAHIDALRVLLPSPGAAKVHRNLLFRLTDLSRALAPTGLVDPRSRLFIWNQCKSSGLTLILCNAAVRTAELDSEGFVITELANCLSIIIDSGIEGGWYPLGDSKEDRELVQSLATVTVPVLEKAWVQLRRNIVSWKQQWLKFGGPITSLVNLASAASRFVEHIFPSGIEESTELDDIHNALKRLRQGMKQSARIEELLLQFIAHANASPDRYGPLVMKAMSCFSTIFRGCLAPLEKVPAGLENLGVVFRDLIMDVEKQDRKTIDYAYYPSTVAVISILLARPDFVSCFQSGESRALRDESKDIRQAMKARQMMGSELCTVTCVDYWFWLRGENNHLIGTAELDVVTIRALLATCYLAAVPSFIPIFSMLLPQGVFVPLLARALVAWQRLGDNALGDISGFGETDWREDIRKYLLLSCRGSVVPMVLGPHIETSTGFLDIVDLLETTKPSNVHAPTDKPMAIWKEFCAVSNLDERAHREKEREDSKKRLDGQVGCAWVKCPMYATEGLERRRPLVCTRCKKTLYCGEFCQERDWERHQFDCQPYQHAHKARPTPTKNSGPLKAQTGLPLNFGFERTTS